MLRSGLPHGFIAKLARDLGLPYRQVYARVWQGDDFGGLVHRSEVAVRVHNDLKRHARAKVTYAVRSGKLPHPSKLHCVNCGGPAAEYDHVLGYEDMYAYAVHPKCSSCHRKEGKMPPNLRSAPISQTQGALLRR